MTDKTVPLDMYSDALDEIYSLRKMLACEARITEAHGEYKTFPKSRRDILDSSVRAMRLAAAGRSELALADPRYRHARDELRNVTGSETLTRAAWEAERARA